MTALSCQDPSCLGWTLLPTDQFCSWCGSRLVELEVAFEFKQGEEWIPLVPPVLNRERRPALRVVVRHVGDSGQVEVRGEHIRSAVPWLGLDTQALEPASLNPGESVSVAISRLKVPGKEDSVQEARIEVEIGSPGDGVQPLSASAQLEFAPPPEAELELATREVLLLPGNPPMLDGAVLLKRGHIWLEGPPEFTGTWARLLPPEGEEPLTCPLELDARSRARVPFRLQVQPEVAQELREAATPPAEGLKRRASLRLPCLDRGTGRKAQAGRGDSPGVVLEVALELAFVLGPELVVAPFPESRRLDWTLLRGVSDGRPLRLVLSNGPPGARGRLELVVHDLDLDRPWLSFPQAPPLPWRIPSGESMELLLEVDRLEPDREDTARLSFVSNDPVPRAYYVRVVRKEPAEFPGWLVVDLGTTNTCAALVDENRHVEMLALDSQAMLVNQLPLAPEGAPGPGVRPGQDTMPSVLCYLELVRSRRFRAGTWAWEQAGHAAASRAVVSGAKRRVGDPRFRYEVVPVDEPAETVALAPSDALRDLYTHVVEKAMEHLSGQGRADLLLKRSVITHPSRFSLHQIEDLKRAVRGALDHHLDRLAPGSGPSEEPATLHEPVGAALHFLNDWRSHAPIHQDAGADELSYHLLVYDYGGGTLDVTLMKVESQRKARPGAQPAASPEGLGGRLRKRLLEHCGRVLLKEKPRAELPSAATDTLTGGNDFVLSQFVESMLRAGGPRLDQEKLAASPQVNERISLSYRCGDSEHERVFTRKELLAALVGWSELAPAREDEDHPWSYTVTPTVLGATGMRWMGGEDVTAVVRDLLVERLLKAVRVAEKAERVELPLDEVGAPGSGTLAARTNRNTLRVWAERLKILLSTGASEDQLRASFQNLYFLLDGEERPLAGGFLFKQAGCPSLDEVHQSLRPRLEETVDMIGRLLGNHALERPDVILRVGKASKLPLVDEVLRAAYPQARYVTPEEAKECVVKGACTTQLPGRVGAGVQIARGHHRPSVRVRLSRQQSLSATTSRLGIKVVDGGRAFFHELVGVGVAVPPEGLTVRLPGVVLNPGLNLLPVLENSGFEDALVDDRGQANPDVETIRVFEIHLPESLDPFDLEEVELEFTLREDLSLLLKLDIPGCGPLEFETIPATEYGRNY